MMMMMAHGAGTRADEENRREDHTGDAYPIVSSDFHCQPHELSELKLLKN